jgi:hypothetical protein
VISEFLHRHRFAYRPLKLRQEVIMQPPSNTNLTSWVNISEHFALELAMLHHLDCFAVTER